MKRPVLGCDFYKLQQFPLGGFLVYAHVNMHIHKRTSTYVSKLIFEVDPIFILLLSSFYIPAVFV